MRDEILSWAEKRLGARRVASKQNASELWVKGHIDGSKVSVQASRSNPGNHTMFFEVPVPDLPILLSLEAREGSDNASVAQGAILAVSTGDPSIDERWLMEAAPAAIAREIVDETVRARIAALPACSVQLEDELLIVQPGDARSIGESELESMLQFALALRSRIVEVHQGRHAQKLDETGDRAEVARLRALRDKWWPRASWPARIAIMVFVAVLLAAALAYVRYSFFPSF